MYRQKHLSGANMGLYHNNTGVIPIQIIRVPIQHSMGEKIRTLITYQMKIKTLRSVFLYFVEDHISFYTKT